MATGTVKWFDPQKGFGFIKPDSGGKDVFVHHTSIKMDGFRTLNEEARVSFQIEETKKGLQAQEVELLEE